MKFNYEAFEMIKKGLSSRPDIEKIVNMDTVEFNLWYHVKKGSIKEQLDKYKFIGNIPDLYFSNESKMGENNTYLKNSIDNLQSILDNLNNLKEFREEYRKSIQNKEIA